MFNKNPNYGPYKVAPVLSYWPSQPLINTTAANTQQSAQIAASVGYAVSAGSTQFLHQPQHTISAVLASSSVAVTSPQMANLATAGAATMPSTTNLSSIGNLKFSEKNLYYAGSNHNIHNIRSPPINTAQNVMSSSFHSPEITSNQIAPTNNGGVNNHSFCLYSN